MKKEIVATLGILIMLSPILIMVIGSDEVVVGEKLCVDGHNNKNLEGIMCEETTDTFFGFNFWFIVIPTSILMTLGAFIFNIGMNKMDDENCEEDVE